MATRTSVGNGNWSAAGTWDTGVPLDGDDVVIAHTVTFDADQSAFVTGVKITVTGTLNHALTGGPYTMFLKTGASLVGAGTWNIGTSADPIPFAVKHTITGAAGWLVDGVDGLTMKVYGAEPSIKTIKLSADAAIGQTELSVDTDVTGDIWADGDIIRIDDINRAQESEERVIAGRAAGTITITAGLTAAKSTGAIISLITRNIKILAVGTGTRTIYRVGNTDNKLTVAGGMWYGVNKNMIETCHYVVVSGGVFSGNNYGLAFCNSATVTGGVFSGNGNGLYSCHSATVTGGVFTGNGNVLITCHSATVSGGTFTGNAYVLITCNSATISGGTFTGNNVGFNSCNSATISGGTFTGNTYVLSSCNSATVSGGTFTGNAYDLRTCTGTLYGITLTSAVENYAYTDLSLPSNQNLQSIDHDGSDGALKAWAKGGIVTSQTLVKPDGYTQAYLHALESAVFPAFWWQRFVVHPGESVTIEVQLRKDASMTYLPRVYLMASVENPLAGDTAVDSFTMTNSTDTWETDTFTVSNETDYDQDYTLWFVAQNATGNAYSAYSISTDGGGAASIAEIQTELATIKAMVDGLEPMLTDIHDTDLPAVKTETAAILADTGTDIPAKLNNIDADVANVFDDVGDANEKLDFVIADTNEIQTELADGGRVDLLIDGLPAEVWANPVRTLTQSAASVAAVLAGSSITIQRGDTETISLTGIGALTGYTKLWFTVKEKKSHADTASLLQIEKTDGLLYVNGAVATTPTDGAITVSDEAAGDLSILIKAAATAVLSPGAYYYDIQMMTAAGINTLTAGTFTVEGDVTRAIA